MRNNFVQHTLYEVIRKRAAKTGNKEAQKEEAVLTNIKQNLEAGISIRALEFSEDDYNDYSYNFV